MTLVPEIPYFSTTVANAGSPQGMLRPRLAHHPCWSKWSRKDQLSTICGRTKRATTSNHHNGASIDTSDLLGGFDQVDLSQQLRDLAEATNDLSEKAPYNAIASMPPDATHSIRILRWLNTPHQRSPGPTSLQSDKLSTTTSPQG